MIMSNARKMGLLILQDYLIIGLNRILLWPLIFFSSIFVAASDRYGWGSEKDLDVLFKEFLQIMEKTEKDIKQVKTQTENND